MQSPTGRLWRTLGPLHPCLVLGLFSLLGCGSGGRPPVDVWLDVDVSIGLPESEVDDGLAMLQAFGSPELRVRGVSAIFGNTSLAKGLPIARRITRDYGPQGLGVFAGAASAEELGVDNEAVQAMAAALRESPMTILALGPATNVATLIQLHPELAEKIESVVLVAARRPGQRFQTGSLGGLPHPDLNFENDPPGLAVLLDSEVPLVFAPWEISSQVEIGLRDLDLLRASGAQGAWVAASCESWLEWWRREFGVDFFNPFDTLAVGWASHPELIECEEVEVWITEGPNDRGPGTKPYLLVNPDSRKGRRGTYCFRPSPEFKPLLLERLGANPQ